MPDHPKDGAAASEQPAGAQVEIERVDAIYLGEGKAIGVRPLLQAQPSEAPPMPNMPDAPQAQGPAVPIDTAAPQGPAGGEGSPPPSPNE